MLKTTLLKVFARDLAKVIAFIKAIEVHIEALIEKERAKLADIKMEIAGVQHDAALKVAKLEEQATDVAHTISIARGLKTSAASAAATESPAS